jgi:hypothetical protein
LARAGIVLEDNAQRTHWRRHPEHYS